MTHSIGDVISLEGTITPTEVVDDYSIVDRDDPTRPAVYASGDLYTYLSTSRETDFDFNFFDFFLPVNGGPPPHYHPLEEEIWHVTDGEFQFNLGSQGELGIVVPEGTTVYVPIGNIHGYRNLFSTATAIGDTPGARTLSMTVPGILGLFFNAAAVEVQDRNDPIPTFEGPTPQDFINLAVFNARTGAGVILNSLDPDYQPPEDARDYVLILPEDATGEVVETAIELNELDGFSIWTTGEQEGLPQRPTFTGDFGIEYTSLVNLEESGNTFAYNEFSLESETTEDFPEPITSEYHELFYVNEGHLTVEINGEVEIADEDNYVHIAPGNEYAIANFSDETVEALSISVPTVEEPDLTSELYPSPVSPLGNIPTNRQVFLGDRADFFNESQETNLYRYIYDVAPGFVDFTVDPMTIDGVDYDGTFVNAAINPATQELAFASGVYQVLEGSLGESESLIEILREDYAIAGREGVITLEFYDAARPLDTVPDEIAQLPQDTQEDLSPDTVVTLPFGESVEQYDWLVIPAEEFAFDVFRDSEGNPAPIVGEGWSVEEYESRRQIFAGGGNDEIYAIKEDEVFGEEGNDFIDASNGLGLNRMYGGEGDDEILVNVDDRAFGGNGDDHLNAAVGLGQPGDPISSGRNTYLDGGSGEDLLIADINFVNSQLKVHYGVTSIHQLW